VRVSHHAHWLEDRCVGNQAALVIKISVRFNMHRKVIRGTEHGDARFATASLSE